MHRDTHQKFAGRTVGLHWLIAVGMVSMLALGLYMEELDPTPFKFQLFGLHKSIGVLILPFALYRIVWRMQNGFPEPVGSYSTIEHVLAKVVHYVLIIATVMMPLSGMMMSGAGGFGIPLFGLELVPANFVDGKAVAYNEAVSGIGKEMHHMGGNLLILAVLLHVVGALKHHIIDKDGTLQRMLGRSV